MKFKLPAALTAAAALLLLSGCASYRAAPLSSLPSEGYKKDDIIVSAKTFDKADCKRYLDRDVIQKGYQPVQLYIQNNSDSNYIFSLSRLSVSTARPDEVARKVHTSTVGRAVGYGVGALFLWPLAIPAVVDGVKSANANEALDNDFSSKTAMDRTIQAHSHFNKLIFVPVSEYQPRFTLELMDQETKMVKKVDVIAS
ncbi:MAG: hypothetical protein JSS60_01695 [Verrucomicrobia bacterium]|nr:hypothetical protein [Verrucomicrobiota bacterium]